MSNTNQLLTLRGQTVIVSYKLKKRESENAAGKYTNIHILQMAT